MNHISTLTRSRWLLLTLFTLLVGVSPAWGQQALPYSYGFETDLGTEGWTRYNCISDSQISTSAAKTGSNGFAFEYSTSQDQYLISPELSGTASGVQVEFYYKNYSSSWPQDFKVGYSTNTDNIGDFTFSIMVNTPTDTDWHLFSESLPANVKYIAIMNLNKDAYWLYIDDISLSVPPAFPKPTGLTLNSTTLNSATLSWTEAGSATKWDVSYSTASGDPDNPVDGGIQAAVTANPYTLEGLTAGTTYYVSVRSTDGTESGAWSDEINFTPGVLTVNEGSTTNYNIPFYYSGTAKSQTIIPASDLTSIQHSAINKLIFYHSLASTNWGTAEIKVYLKEVDKQVFASATFDNWEDLEEVYSGTLSVVGNKMEVTFDNPFVYESGNLLIGFDKSTAGTSSSYNPWYGKTATGNVSLYKTSYDPYQSTFAPKVSIAYSPIANFVAKPTNVAQSAYTSTSVTLGWDNPGDVDSWEVSYRETKGDPAAGTVKTANSNSKTLEGLTAETTYYVYVRAKKGEYYSAWTAPLPVTPTAAVDLTIYDKTNTASQIPVYGPGSRTSYSQFIIPSSALTLVQNGTIKQLTFYATSASKTLNSYNVYIQETDDNVFTSTNASVVTGMTNVYSGVLYVIDGKMTVVFSAPFNYTTKNLKVAFAQQSARDESLSWYGENQTSNVAIRYNSGSSGYVQFLPKTTINYIPAALPTNPVLQVTDPEINVMGASPVNYDFGLTETAETRNFTIENAGAGTLTVKSITATGGYTLKIGDADATTSIGSTIVSSPLTLKVIQPAGTSSGTITFTTDVDGDSNDETYVINVSGMVRDVAKLYVSDFSSKPTGWTATGNTWSYTAANGASTSAWYLTSNARLYTPKATVAAEETFIFEAKGIATSGNESYQHLQLQYSADGETWTTIGSEVSLTSDWKTFTVSTPNNFEAGNYYIALNGSQVAVRKFYGGTETLEPVIALSPTTKAFNLVTNAEAQTQVFTASNSGKADLKNLTVAVPSGFSITKEDDSEWVNTQTVAANDGSQTFKVTMSTDPGVYSGNITIDGVYGDAPGTPIEQKTIAISGAVRDSECLFADFEASKPADRKPTEWTNTNWAFDNGKFVQAAYSGTSTLITQKLGISAGQKLIFMANKPYTDATLGIFYCATNSVNDGDWTEVTPAAISTAATNTDIYYEVSVGDGDGLIPVGDYFIKFVGTKYIKLDDISYFKEPLVGKFEMYEYDGEAAEPYLGTEVTENQTVNLGNNVTATQTIKYVVKNAGTAAMSVTGGATGNITIAPTAPVNLAVGATQEYTITMAYDAEHLGGKSGVATISAAELGEYTVTVSGTTRDGSKAFVDFAAGESVPTTWTNSGWQKYSFNSDKYVYATSEDAGVPSRMTTSRMVVAAGGENLAIKAMKSDEAGTLVVYYAATQDGFTGENKSDISTQLNTGDYESINVIIPEGMEYVAFDGYKVRIAEIYGLTNAPSMKVRKTAEGANLTSGMTVDFGLTASADAETFYVVNASAGSLAGIDAALTGTGFTLNKTNLTAAGGDFTIAVDPTVKGYREATVTVSGTDQENFVINLKAFVAGADGKMHETFNTESHPTGWTATGFTATAEGETLGENGSGTLRTTLMSVEANEKLAIRVKANKSSSLTDLKVKFYQKGANAPAATVDLSDILASNTDEHTVYASIATAGNYYVEFDGSYISLLEVAGFAYNANDPTIAVYSDALATQEVATATTKDFGWVADDADAAAFTSTYYIKNNGTGTLTISNISEVEGFTAATAGDVMSVAAGADPLALTITMNKAVIGAKSGTFTLTTDGGNFTIPVKGFVYDHSKNLVDFTANEATFPAGWTAGSWTISDGAAISASESTIQTKKFTVAANENLYIDIKGNSGNGTKTFAYSYSTDNGANWSEANTLISESGYGIVADQVLTISDIASTTEERTVLVRITGQNLGIKHIYGFTRVDEAIMSTTAVAHDFGMQASNVNPATNAYVFTVQNDGNIDLTNLAVTLEGAEESAFAVAVAGSKTTLTAGESVDVTVTMKSSTVYGAKNDNLTIAAEGQTPVVIALSGKTRDVAKQFIDFNELDAIPAGWTAGDWTVSTPPASSDKAAYANGETTMISPAMTIAANEKLHFDARVLTAGSLTVSYTTNGGATWNEMNNLVALNSMTAQELSFGNDAEVTAFVKFTGKSAYIDNIYGGVATTAPLMDIATTEVANGDGKYDFGQDLMAAPADKVFTITNIGSDNLVATIAATGDVTAEFETTGTKNDNEVTLANGQTATITVSMAYEAENAGAKTGAVTITSAAGVATLNFIGKTIDNRTLSVDFADGLQPEGWYFGTNWSVNAYSQFASNDANSTPGDLITQQLIVDGTEDELTFKAAKTNNSYTFKVYTSQDRVEWNEVDLSALTLTESYKTVTVSGLAAGNYYLKISGAFVKVDDFLGWKKVTGIEHDLYVTTTTFPATTTKGNEATITATVTSLIAAETGVYAKLFINDAEEATAAAQDIALNGTKTFSFSYAIPENKMAQIKVYYGNDHEAFATAENAMRVNYTLEQTSSEAITAGTFNVTVDRTFVAGWNTICLPFAVTATEMKAKYGENVALYELTSFTDGNLQFTKLGEEIGITEGNPYLIYVEDAITESKTFVDATISATSPANIVLPDVTFHGTFAPIAADGVLTGKYGISSDGRIAKANSATYMNGFRGYLEGNLAGARISIFDEATGISRIYDANEVFGKDAKVYNLNGQKVENAKKGLYIVNGRKVVVK